jgi:hypothetical protein
MDWAALASRIVVGKGDTNHLKWDGRPGHYEVWFLTFNARAERLGFWLRYTLDAPLAGAPFRELWAHVFDAAAPERSFGVRTRFPVQGPLAGPHELFTAGGAVLAEGLAHGRAEGGGHAVEWDLAFDSDPCSAYLAPYLLRKLGISKTRSCSPTRRPLPRPGRRRRPRGAAARARQAARRTFGGRGTWSAGPGATAAPSTAATTASSTASRGSSSAWAGR